jgi:hypothetical protein
MTLHNQPWHQGLDFDRANFVASSAEGEEGIQNKIDDLRAQAVEASLPYISHKRLFTHRLTSLIGFQMRKLKHQLDLANKKLDKQVKGLELEKQAAGFVLDLAEESGRESRSKKERDLPHCLTISNHLIQNAIHSITFTCGGGCPNLDTRRTRFQARDL